MLQDNFNPSKTNNQIEQYPLFRDGADLPLMTGVPDQVRLKPSKKKPAAAKQTWIQLTIADFISSVTGGGNR